MSLPLLERAAERWPFCSLSYQATEAPGRETVPARGTQLPVLRPGEQYRFHFDMAKCIGCRCCEVACNEQNHNPPGVRWRRVGEMEGGVYPDTRRYYISLGCNHCLEPSCLTGCPVDAYRKDPASGIVLHDPQACIGCQYCTWNCPYGVPQYNPERGVVGKCDLCHGRLAEGRLPACVSACPQEAIQVEAVDVEAWRRRQAAGANAPGLPPAELTLSTTRITLPDRLPGDLQRADAHDLRLEPSHMPLVWMTVLTQLSVGTVAALLVWLLIEERRLPAGGPAAALAAGVAAGLAATLHLGRPIYAYRAVKMWRRSWLSREVLLFACFALCCLGYAVSARWADASALPGALAALFGAAGVYASARIYQVPARPAWNTSHTLADFILAALCLGPLALSAMVWTPPPWLAGLAVTAAGLQLMNQVARLIRLSRSEDSECRATARLLCGRLEKPFLVRLGLGLLTGVTAFLPGFGPVALCLALMAELLGRWLFFVSVVPRQMAGSFFRRVAEVS